MKNTKKATCALRRVLLLILILSLALTGCGRGDAGLECGFYESNLGGYYRPISVGLKSSKSEFDINDVTLDFHYGFMMGDDIEYDKENVRNYGEFDLYFRSDSGEEYFVRHIDEPLMSEKYRVELDHYNGKWSFNHSEEITVPAELFTEGTGKFQFRVYAVVLRPEVPHYYVGDLKNVIAAVFYYKINDRGMIELSDQPFD